MPAGDEPLRAGNALHLCMANGERVNRYWAYAFWQAPGKLFEGIIGEDKKKSAGLDHTHVEIRQERDAKHLLSPATRRGPLRLAAQEAVQDFSEECSAANESGSAIVAQRGVN